MKILAIHQLDPLDDESYCVMTWDGGFQCWALVTAPQAFHETLKALGRL